VRARMHRCRDQRKTEAAEVDLVRPIPDVSYLGIPASGAELRCEMFRNSPCLAFSRCVENANGFHGSPSVIEEAVCLPLITLDECTRAQAVTPLGAAGST